MEMANTNQNSRAMPPTEDSNLKIETIEETKDGKTSDPPKNPPPNQNLTNAASIKSARTTLNLLEDPASPEAGENPDPNAPPVVIPLSMHIKQATELIAEHWITSIIMSFLTLWALYDDDIRLSSTDHEADPPFRIIISIAFFMFLLEIIAQCIYKPGYLLLPSFEPIPNESFYSRTSRALTFGSFYFWLDLIATGSLVMQMPWIVGDSLEGNAQSLKSVRAGRASRAGARAGRIIRLVRMVKLYKYYKKEEEDLNEGGASGYDSRSGVHTSSAEDLAAPAKKKKRAADSSTNNASGIMEESRVGAAMSDITSKRVIVLVLGMLIIIPLLSVSFADKSDSFYTQMIHRFAANEDLEGLDYSIQYMKEHSKIVKLSIKSPNPDVMARNFEEPMIKDLRSAEKLVYEYTYGETKTQTFVNMKSKTVKTALYGIYLTTFILVILVVATFFFTKDVNHLVIYPIEKMVALVQKISENPLAVNYNKNGSVEDGFIEGMETTLLLQTINKLGNLMKVGFGQAGANVIARNLKASDGSASMNLLGGAYLIHSIFGFCDVRNFTDTTECLQEEVMLFVNRIAHILHSIVVQCSGSANKNIGDAFLLTWLIAEEMSPLEVSYLADQALVAFLKALIELNRYQEFICDFSQAASMRLYQRFPGYKVRIGCGLHMGWAVEGAIGSSRKIDATYLSPHVNMSEFLESSTKQYGVPLLLSEAFYRLLTPSASRYVRQVDRIRRSDGEEPFGLYTYDADINHDFSNGENKQAAPKVDSTQRRRSVQGLLKENNNPNPPPSGQRGRGSVLSVGKKEEKKEEAPVKKELNLKAMPKIKVKVYNEHIWDIDKDIMKLRHLVNDSFRILWQEGINAYIQGDWKKALDIFQETSRVNPKDGPSHFLLHVIKKHDGCAPRDWPGFREDGH